jgi:hypothetical protein
MRVPCLDKLTFLKRVYSVEAQDFVTSGWLSHTALIKWIKKKPSPGAKQSVLEAYY